MGAGNGRWSPRHPEGGCLRTRGAQCVALPLQARRVAHSLSAGNRYDLDSCHDEMLRNAQRAILKRYNHICDLLQLSCRRDAEPYLDSLRRRCSPPSVGNNADPTQRQMGWSWGLLAASLVLSTLVIAFAIALSAPQLALLMCVEATAMLLWGCRRQPAWARSGAALLVVLVWTCWCVPAMAAAAAGCSSWADAAATTAAWWPGVCEVLAVCLGLILPFLFFGAWQLLEVWCLHGLYWHERNCLGLRRHAVYYMGSGSNPDLQRYLRAQRVDMLRKAKACSQVWRL